MVLRKVAISSLGLVNIKTGRTTDLMVTSPVLLRLGEPPVPVPEPFASLPPEHTAAHRGNMNTAANPHARWLFPGHRAGEPLHPSSLLALVRALGVPTQARPDRRPAPARPTGTRPRRRRRPRLPLPRPGEPGATTLPATMRGKTTPRSCCASCPSRSSPRCSPVVGCVNRGRYLRRAGQGYSGTIHCGRAPHQSASRRILPRFGEEHRVRSSPTGSSGSLRQRACARPRRTTMMTQTRTPTGRLGVLVVGRAGGVEPDLTHPTRLLL